MGDNELDYYMGVPISLIAAIRLMSPEAITKMMEMATEAAEREQLKRLQDKYGVTNG